MSFINYANHEINCKVVYCGPGLAGKTTNVAAIYETVNASNRGRLISLNTDSDRTLFFDFLPLDLGRIGGFSTRFHLYTVPGQVVYQASRKLILKGADGVVFVADSDPERMDANIESLRDLRSHLRDYGYRIGELPYALQLNKRDLFHTIPKEMLLEHLKLGNEPVFEAVARDGAGVSETFKAVARRVLENLRKEIS
jgi:signal recognition particle receptor subunit beta